jgi:hypothetical protein
MPRKTTAPPKLSRASKNAYAKAVADAGEQVALKQNDPAAIMDAARRKVADAIDKSAAANPATARTVRFAKHGNFKRF